MHLRRLEISKLRSFDQVELSFNRPRSRGLRYPNVNVLLGDNGTGKTTILRAAALGTLAPVLAKSSGFVPDGLIRREPHQRGRLRLKYRHKKATAKAFLTLDPQDAVKRKALTLKAEIIRTGDEEHLQWAQTNNAVDRQLEKAQAGTNTSAFFIVGYGATRRVEVSERVDESARLKSRARRYERVAGLFEEHVTLTPLSLWLPSFERKNPGRHKQVVNLMNRLLPEACRMQAKAQRTPSGGRENLFEMNGVLVPFRALSDGYRAYVGWIADMLYHLCMTSPSGRKLVDNRGVVLIDEVDLHLHPDWQRTVMPTLANELPNVQFIVTTHSPLVVGSLEAGNLFVLVSTASRTEVRRQAERVHGKSSEQILLSPYFGLETTRPPEVAAELRKLEEKAKKGDRKASLQYVRVLASGR